MNKNMQSTMARLGALAAALLLSACVAPPPKPLYQWSNYQGKLYEYFKATDLNVAEHVQVLEAQVQKNKALGEATPPGMHGHLALLYTKLGNETAARQHLETERALFPESAAYIDFLLKTPATPAAKS